MWYGKEGMILLNNVNTFAEIAHAHLALSRSCRQLANTAPSTDAYTEAIMEGRQHAMVTIVFSAMTLEAYINEYAARKRSKSFFKEHLNKLRTQDKWVVISELFSGVPFPKSDNCYQHLDTLIQLRHQLVHNKPKVLDLSDAEAAKKAGDHVYAIFESAEQAVQTITEIVRCLIEMDPEEKARLALIAGITLEI